MPAEPFRCDSMVQGSGDGAAKDAAKLDAHARVQAKQEASTREQVLLDFRDFDDEILGRDLLVGERDDFELRVLWAR